MEKDTPLGPSSDKQSIAPTFEGPVDLNTTSVDVLRQLPGIGKAIATRIVANRDEQGPFSDAWDVLRVPGVTYRVVARIVDRLVVDGIPARPRASLRPSQGPSPRSLPPEGFISLAPRVSLGPRPAGYVDFLSETPPAGPAASAKPPPPQSSRRTEDVPDVLSVPPMSAHRESGPISAVQGPLSSLTQPAGPRVSRSPSAPAVVAAAPPAAPAPAKTSPRRRAFGAYFANRGEWVRAASVAALCIVAGTVGAMYGTRSQAQPTRPAPEGTDGEKTRKQMDLFAELASQFPKTNQRIDALSAAVDEGRKESTEAQASMQKLTQEVGSLRKAQRDTDRRVSEMRGQVEVKLRSGLPPPARAVDLEPEGWARPR